MSSDTIVVMSLQKGDKLVDSKVANKKAEYTFKKLESKTKYTLHMTYILDNGQKVDKAIVIYTK